MALWSALGFLFLPRSQSCTRSRLRRPRPWEDTSGSPTAGTSHRMQVRGTNALMETGRDKRPLYGVGGGSQPWDTQG